jgi:hypothetical protein
LNSAPTVTSNGFASLPGFGSQASGMSTARAGPSEIPSSSAITAEPSHGRPSAADFFAVMVAPIAGPNHLA